jgi:hypothetical protein
MEELRAAPEFTGAASHLELSPSAAAAELDVLELFRDVAGYVGNFAARWNCRHRLHTEVRELDLEVDLA